MKRLDQFVCRAFRRDDSGALRYHGAVVGNVKINDGVCSNRNVVSNMDRPTDFCAWPNVAVLPDSGHHVLAAQSGFRTDHHAWMNPAIWSNSGCAVYDYRPRMRYRKTGSKNIGRNQNPKISRGCSVADSSDNSTNEVAIVGVEFQNSEAAFDTPNIIRNPCSKPSRGKSALISLHPSLKVVPSKQFHLKFGQITPPIGQSVFSFSKRAISAAISFVSGSSAPKVARPWKSTPCLSWRIWPFADFQPPFKDSIDGDMIGEYS